MIVVATIRDIRDLLKAKGTVSTVKLESVLNALRGALKKQPKVTDIPQRSLGLHPLGFLNRMSSPH